MSGPRLIPDKSAIEKFLSGTVQEDIHLAAFGEKGAPICKSFGNDAQRAADWAEGQNAQGRGVYWTVNCTIPNLNRKPAKTDMIAARYLHLDIDPPFDLEATLASLRDAKCPPSFVVSSGNGIQASWRLTLATLDFARVEEMNRRLCDAYSGDKSTFNIDRLMRLPGTINYPNAKKRTRGAVPVLAAVLYQDTGVAMHLDEIEAGLGSSCVPPLPQHLSTAPICPNPGSLFDLNIRPGTRLYEMIIAPSIADRSHAVFACASEMLKAGFNDDKISEILSNPEYAISAHCLDQPLPGRAISRAIAAARRGMLESGEGYGSSVELEDFYAYMPTHQYIFIPSGEFWPAASVNARLSRVGLIAKDGTPLLDSKNVPKFINASTWLDQERPVEQLVWAPGHPKLIKDRLVD